MRVQDVSFGVQPTKLLGFGSTTAVCFYCVDCLTRLQVHKELEIQSVKENGSALQYPFHNHFRINLMVNTKPDSRAANPLPACSRSHSPAQVPSGRRL